MAGTLADQGLGDAYASYSKPAAHGDLRVYGRFLGTAVGNTSHLAAPGVESGGVCTSQEDVGVYAVVTCVGLSSSLVVSLSAMWMRRWWWYEIKSGWERNGLDKNTEIGVH